MTQGAKMITTTELKEFTFSEIFFDLFPYAKIPGALSLTIVKFAGVFCENLYKN
jgi:hypothetical protein